MNKRVVSLVLSLIGVGGVGITSWLAVKCSKKADERETLKEKLIAYAPAIVSGVGTSACILGSHHISSKEIAALTATCTYLTANRKKIEKKIEEKFGKSELLNIKKEIGEEKVTEEKKLNKGQTIEETGHGDVLFFDIYLGRKFRSSLAHVEWAEKQINNDFHSGSYVCMNDFYDYLGIEKTIIGDTLGWPANEDYYDYELETPIEFENIKAEDDNGELMYVIDINYETTPCNFWKEV